MSLQQAPAFTESDKQRFNSQYTPVTESGCWLWDGGLSGGGYGQFWAQGECVRAHRFSWIIHNGQVPKDLYVLHKCDVKLCCNPKHLYLGTLKDNARDAKERGLIPERKGEKAPVSKLIHFEVKEIRKLSREGYSTGFLAKAFQVSPATISMVKSGKRWAHI